MCEVKQFDSLSPLDVRAAISIGSGGSRAFTASDDEVYGPIRRQVHEAARQMRELRESRRAACCCSRESEGSFRARGCRVRGACVVWQPDL